MLSDVYTFPILSSKQQEYIKTFAFSIVSFCAVLFSLNLFHDIYYLYFLIKVNTQVLELVIFTRFPLESMSLCIAISKDLVDDLGENKYSEGNSEQEASIAKG